MEVKTIDILIRKFYALSVGAHVAHVNTKSFAAHEALGEFYGKVNDTKDRLIEYHIGERRIVKVSASIIEVGENVEMEASALAEMFCNYAKGIADEAMINLSGEFEEAVGKLKFLLMLS